MLRGIRLAQFILELSVQIILRVHNIQVFIFVPVPFVLLVLAGAADVVEDLPQLVTLGWPCERRRRDVIYLKNNHKNTHKDLRRARQMRLGWDLIRVTVWRAPTVTCPLRCSSHHLCLDCYDWWRSSDCGGGA